MTVLRSGSATDVGRVRSLNEDVALESPELYAVADGMGGHVGGEVASRIAVDALREAFLRDSSTRGLLHAVTEANERVYDRSRSDPEVRGMGTTLVAAALVGTEAGDRLVLANVGDSRAYRYRSGRVAQLSLDHSVAEELRARGELSQAQAAVHPQRHILTRALGVGPDVEVDAWQIAPLQGDRYLLCSDGLTNEVSDDTMAGALSSLPDPGEAARTLVKTANEHGGNDNVTVVVLDVMVGDAKREEEAEPAPLTPSAEAIGRQPRSTTATLFAYDRAQPSNGGNGAVSRWEPTGSGGRNDPRAERSDTLSVATLLVPPMALPGLQGGPDGDVDWVSVPARPPGRHQRPGRGPAKPGTERTRVVTFRVLLFVILMAAVLYGAWWGTGWYFDNSWFVRIPHGSRDLVIYQGRPSGFLWYQPTPVANTRVGESQVPSTFWPALRTGVEEPSRAAAEQYVTRLEQELNGQQGSSPPTTATLPATPPTTSAT